METEDQRREFNVAAWLHDCGKVTTPEYVVDKATKLETIYNRIHEIRMRFEVLLRDAQIDYYGKCLAGENDQKALDKQLKRTRDAIREDFAFPEYLKNVAEYAGGHHETMIGTGYPRRLKKEQLPIPARILAIADIFEALTAADRPYKPPKTVSETLRIMSLLRDQRHIDAELFDLFLRSGVYQSYAERFLGPDQIDKVDVGRYLSKTAVIGINSQPLV
jgi:HD-GYP domain-containing protein (c-di-GMP phosphodiesterase class II)